MLIHNPKDWIFFIFTIHKSDTLRALLPMLLTIALYSFGVAYWELNYVDVSENSWLKNIPVMHSLLGFAISILLVFRTNTAYDRWWEGRRQWGLLVNASRNLALKIASDATLPQDDKAFFKRIIPLYAVNLKTHLLSQGLMYSLDENEHPELADMNDTGHGPSLVAYLMIERINHLESTGVINQAKYRALLNDINIFTDVCGACERIKNTPIPHSYSAFMKKFIFIYVMTLPFGYVFSLSYYVIPIVVMVFYVLASMEIIAEEIEDPFGSDLNDLPLDKLSENIGKQVRQIFETRV